MKKIMVLSLLSAARLIILAIIPATGCGKKTPAEPAYPSHTFTASPQDTGTVTRTATATGTRTPTETATGTATHTPTSSITPTLTETPTFSETPTFTATATATNMPCSCYDIQQKDPGSASGLYDIRVLGETIQVFCDMERQGGGWTLVLLNSVYATAPKPFWNELVNSVNVTGSMEGGLTAFDLFLGVKFWNALGSTLMVETGDNPTSISHRATYTFALDPANDYRLMLSNENVLINTGITASPGIYSYHNNKMLSARDRDKDSYNGSCCYLYNNTAWWYAACWSGSFWGGGGGPVYQNKAYWSGNGSEYYDYGAIWVR